MAIFQEWLNKTYLFEAIINRGAIPMDEDDINYLRQVPREFWKSAIKHRYNDFLIQAAEALESGNQINDIQNVVLNSSIGTGPRKRAFELNTGMSKLVKKLQGLGFDLSDPQRASSTLGSMHLMSGFQAAQLIKNWVAQSPDGELNPGFKQYTPNKLQSKINSLDDTQEAERRFLQIKPQMEQIARRIIDKKLSTMSSVTHPLHINYYYWNERKDELVKDLLNVLKNNLNESPDRYYYIMSNRMNNLIQTGHVSRRLLDRANREGVNISLLLKKGYTVQQITDAINSAANAGGSKYINSKFNFNIGQVPQQQSDLKTIHQSVPSQNASINYYGRNTLLNKRNRATDKILQRKEPASSTYSLAAESFKTWIENFSR